MANQPRINKPRTTPPAEDAPTGQDNHPDFLWSPRRISASGSGVNSADLADWQANYGASAAAASEGEPEDLADPGGDGNSDGRDFLIWQRTGTPAATDDGPSTLADLGGAPSSPISAYPEPFPVVETEPELDLDL
jgi:hypothetical protein